MTGHNMLEALRLTLELVYCEQYTVDFIGSIIQKLENVLVKPGWFALRQVSFKLTIVRSGAAGVTAELAKALQSLPDKHLNHLPKLDSVAFNYSVEHEI